MQTAATEEPLILSREYAAQKHFLLRSQKRRFSTKRSKIIGAAISDLFAWSMKNFHRL